MKKMLLPLLLAFCFSANAQNVVGYWYGTANVASGAASNNYLVELIIQQKQAAVQAVLNYYFKNTYRSIRLNGNYNTISRELSFSGISVPYAGNTGGIQVDCEMDFRAIHRVAKAGSNLTGRFIAKESHRYMCPDLVFDLKLNKDAGNLDSVLTALRNFKETYQVWSPTAIRLQSCTKGSILGHN